MHHKLELEIRPITKLPHKTADETPSGVGKETTPGHTLTRNPRRRWGDEPALAWATWTGASSFPLSRPPPLFPLLHPAVGYFVDIYEPRSRPLLGAANARGCGHNDREEHASVRVAHAQVGSSLRRQRGFRVRVDRCRFYYHRR